MLPDIPYPTPTFPTTTEQTTGTLPQGGVFAVFPIEAEVAQVYAVLSDHASMSSWIPKLTRSTLIETQNPCAQVAFAVPSPIGEITYDLYRCASNNRIWWERAAGDRFESIRGCYDLQSLGPTTTLVRYWSEVVAAIPVSASIQAEVAKIGLTDLIESLKAEVQRRYP